MTNIMIGMIGIFCGAFLVYLLSLSKTKHAAERGRLEGETERSILAERLRSKEEQVQELRVAVETAHHDVASLRETLRLESDRRSVAEEKNTRIPELETIVASREENLLRLTHENTDLKLKLSEIETRLVEERKAVEEKIMIVDESKQKLSDAFKALSADVLKSSNQAFLALARESLEKYQDSARNDLQNRQKAIDELVKPLQSSLEKVDTRIREIENVRTTAYVSLTEQIKSLSTSQSQLQTETSKLVMALKTPTVRGRWGEIQLKRVVEIAGMLRLLRFRAAGIRDNGRWKTSPGYDHPTSRRKKHRD